MAGIIPQHKVDEIREATDIVELISDYVTLKKKGQSFFGLCPFHNEKTPSFNVHPEKQIFHCFGCGAGGNAVTFLMRYENSLFPDVIRFLAQRAGIYLEYEEPEQDAVELKRNEALYHINEWAARWFQENLFDNAGKDALAYIKGRGMSEDDIRTFGIGYAKPGWDNLLTDARKAANDSEILFQAGLVLQNDTGKRYDRFRDRLMFPIWNLSGRVIAFGGRILRASDDSPKYINSPETAVYDKSNTLYGLFQNRDEIRSERKVIFVEGYMDCLSLVARGVRNVVATSGTALTEKHARLVRRYTPNVVLMYDSDAAGSAASLRGSDVLIENGLDVSVVTLPEGHDPDSFIREKGSDELRQCVKAAAPLFDYKLQLTLAKPPEERTQSIRDWLGSVAKLKDIIARSLLVTKASQQLGMSEKILWAELESQSRKNLQRTVRRSEIANRLDTLSSIGKVDTMAKAADNLIRVLLHDWAQADLVFNKLDFNTISGYGRLPILSYLKNQYKSGGQPTEASLLHQFNDVALSEFIITELSRTIEDIDTRRLALDCIHVVWRAKLQTEIDAVREQIKSASGDSDRLSELLRHCMSLEREKASLDSRSSQTV